MKTANQNQLFRLAAVLYAGNSYEVSSKTIHRKIIESALLSNGNSPLNTHQLIDYIFNTYNLCFDENEVKDIVTNDKTSENFLLNEKGGNIIVCLTEKRKQTLESRVSNKTIDYFIAEFEKEKATLVTGSNCKEIIYRFLYELLSANIESFRKLLNSKNSISDLINVESESYSSIEREIINEFLSWDNNDKNKAIFDIASYALEYCMISNNGNGTHIQLNNLKNKIFYLDTNVIFRALGLNGENRKNRTNTFLKKFIESNTSLVISKFSEKEFKDTVAYYILKLNKKPIVRRLNPEIFKERYFKNVSELYDFYYKWRVGKMNDSIELFEAYVLSLYEKFKVDFKIDTDYKMPFEEKDEKIEKQINDLSNSIGSYKNTDGANHGVNADLNDALNVTLVENRREGKNLSIFDTKYFIVSTDQSLRRWDYSRNNATPVIMLPSQWLSILLRFISRTNDDFKSFVSFLNLPNSDTSIDSEKLHAILTGISEMTENFEQQQYLVHSIVQKKFNGILEKGIKDEEVLERTKAFAKAELEKKIEEIEGKHDNLRGEHESHKALTTKQIEELKELSSSQAHKLSQSEQENIELKKKLQKTYISNKIKNWKRPAYWAIPLVVLILIFYYFQIFYSDWSYNYVQQLITYIDNNPSETKRDWMKAINTGLFVGVGTLLVFCYQRLISKDKREDKLKSIQENMPKEYK
jgi:hypothetical protein